MTELETRLLDMLNQEREEAEREKRENAIERKTLLSAIESLAEQNQQIIELLQKPTDGDSLETILRKILNDFQSSLIASLTQSLRESKSI